MAANTLSSYRRDLRRYLEFLDGQGISELSGVSEATVSAFLVRLREGDPGEGGHPALSATSAARTLVAVRGFHRFAVRDGLATVDPAAAVKPPSPDQTTAQGAAARGRRGDPGRGRRARHRAGAAGPGAARGALRHRRAHLRGGRPRRRRPRPGRRHGAAAGQGQQGAAGARRVVRRRGRGGLPHPGPAGPRRRVGLDARRAAGRSAARCSSTRAAAGCPGSRRGRSWSGPRSAPASPPTSRRTRCGTRSPPTCSTAAPTCAWSRSSSGTPR